MCNLSSRGTPARGIGEQTISLLHDTAPVVSVVIAILMVPSQLMADPIRHERLANFVLHTDLPAAEVAPYKQRMQRTLSLAERYWGRRLAGDIECYLVAELANWQPSQLPSSHARRVIRYLRGGTDLQPVGAFTDASQRDITDKRNAPRPRPRTRRVKRSAAKQAVIYASTDDGVLEHEVVHAYCHQVFGRGGPDWYREGMAEVLARQVAETRQEPCSAQTLACLQNHPVPRLKTLLRDNRNFLGDLTQSVIRTDDAVKPAPASGWNARDESNLAKAKVAYAHSWALCYLLSQNRNYQDRFRLFGRHLLAGARIGFEDVFAAQLQHIDFELRHFTQHIDRGYRLQQCSWQWPAATKSLQVGDAVIIRLQAGQGFQTTSLLLKSGEQYVVQADGTWEVGGEPTSADGQPDGRGRLVATTLREFQLSPSHELGRHTQWQIRHDGHLYLRCSDDWHHVADNRGRMVVKITRQQ